MPGEGTVRMPVLGKGTPDSPAHVKYDSSGTHTTFYEHMRYCDVTYPKGVPADLLENDDVELLSGDVHPGKKSGGNK